MRFWSCSGAAASCAAFALLFACGTSDDSIPPPDDGGTALGDGGTLPDGAPIDATKDGGSSSGDDSGGPTGPFCASLNPAADLCEDWDDGTVPAQSQFDPKDSPRCSIDNAQFKSAPSSFKCVSPGAPGTFANALLGIATDAPTSAKKRTIGFAFRPDSTLPTTGDLVIARAFVSDNRSITIELSSEVGAVMREQSQIIDNHVALSAKPAVGSWTRYTLAIDVGAKRATLTANGAEVASLALKGIDAGDTSLNLGLQSSAAFTAYYDDVTIDWE